MPELPEVEIVRRVLQDRYVGKAITAVALGKPTFYRAPPLAAIKILTGGESPHVRFQMWIGTEAVRFHDSRRFGQVGCPLPARPASDSWPRRLEERHER